MAEPVYLCEHYACRCARAAELAAQGLTVEAIEVHSQRVHCRERPAEFIHMRPAEGSCEVHGWTEDELLTRLAPLMRERHGRGGVNVCVRCLERARDAARARSGA